MKRILDVWNSIIISFVIFVCFLCCKASYTYPSVPSLCVCVHLVERGLHFLLQYLKKTFRQRNWWLSTKFSFFVFFVLFFSFRLMVDINPIAQLHLATVIHLNFTNNQPIERQKKRKRQRFLNGAYWVGRWRKWNYVLKWVTFLSTHSTRKHAC